MKQYLASSTYIEWQHPLVTEKASEFVNGCQNDEVITKRCFEFVRDEIKNSWD